MKLSYIAVSLFIMASLFAFSCRKNNSHATGTIYTATLKTSTPCARYYACIITDGNIDPELVDNNWKFEGETYQHAFEVRNNCDFPRGRIENSSSFRFKIAEQAVVADCAICNIAITGAPSKSLTIEVIQ